MSCRVQKWLHTEERARQERRERIHAVYKTESSFFMATEIKSMRTEGWNDGMKISTDAIQWRVDVPRNNLKSNIEKQIKYVKMDSVCLKYCSSVIYWRPLGRLPGAILRMGMVYVLSWKCTVWRNNADRVPMIKEHAAFLICIYSGSSHGVTKAHISTHPIHLVLFGYLFKVSDCPNNAKWTLEGDVGWQ